MSMADWILDCALDNEDPFGSMDEDTYYTPFGYYPRFKPRAKTDTCKYCRTTGLHWKLLSGKYRLVTATEAVHSCQEFARSKQQFEGF